MDAGLVAIIVTIVLVAAGGLWMITRESPPANKHPEPHSPV